MQLTECPPLKRPGNLLPGIFGLFAVRCSKFSDEAMSSKFTRSVSLELLTVNESRSTDFGLSGNCSESSFGFDTGSVSNFDKMVETSPLILK